MGSIFRSAHQRLQAPQADWYAACVLVRAAPNTSSITFGGWPRSPRQLRRAARRSGVMICSRSEDDPPPTGMSTTTGLAEEEGGSPLLVPSAMQTSTGWARRGQSGLFLPSRAGSSTDRMESGWTEESKTLRDPSSILRGRLSSMHRAGENDWQRSEVERSMSSQRDRPASSKRTGRYWRPEGPVSNPLSTMVSSILRRPECSFHRVQKRRLMKVISVRTS